MTVAEAAAALECSPKTIYAMCRKGRLRSYRVGAGKGHLRITECAIRDYLASPPTEAAEERKPARRPAPKPSGHMTLDDAARKGQELLRARRARRP